MSTPVTVSSFEVKALDSPDEVRTPKTRVEVVRLGASPVGPVQFRAGLALVGCIKPVVGTESCQVSHVGYAVSGEITIRLSDGTERRIRAGEAYTIRQAMMPGLRGTSPSWASK